MKGDVLVPLALACLCGVPPALPQNPDPSSEVASLQLEKETALGRSLAAEIEQRSKILEDPVIAAFVQALGQQLAGGFDKEFPLTIKVVDSPWPVAIVLPGGFVFIHSGLIARAATKAELAGGMAHGIAHVAARHGMRLAGTGTGLGPAPLIFVAGWGGLCARLSPLAVPPAAFRSATEQFEEEADLLGLASLYQAGYDPQGFADFFDRLSDGDGNNLHPPRQKARQKLKDYLEREGESVTTDSEFAKIKTRVRHATGRENSARPSLVAN